MNRSSPSFSAFGHPSFYTKATPLQPLLFQQIPKLLSAQKTCRLGIMKMMQISQNIPFPAPVLCSSAQLEPAVSAGQRPTRPCAQPSAHVTGKGPGTERRAAAGRPARPEPQARHEPHGATRPSSTLTLGTRLESFSLYYWEIIFFFLNNILQMFSREKEYTGFFFLN